MLAALNFGRSKGRAGRAGIGTLVLLAVLPLYI